MTSQSFVPYISDAVERQRLFKVLDDNCQKQNMLISGQAAQGKSTLVASYLKASAIPVLWIDLSSDDNDHIKLFDKLIAKVQDLFYKDTNQSDSLNFNGVLGTEKGVLRHIQSLSSILAELPSNLVIVFDDLEHIDETSPGFELIKGTIDQKFNRHIFFLLSRKMPSFNIPKLKLSHNIFILNNEQLAFTLDETKLFFSQKPQIGRADVEKIHKITDGWAGGLTLISESLRQFNKIQALPEHLSSEVFEFFSQEIYKRLPGSIRDFLRKTAILETIDLEVVNHILTTDNALDILSDLESRNLFIQRIDSGHKQFKFKYHNLFKDFLLQDLLADKGKKVYQSLNQKVGQFFWDKKDHEQALNYFYAADAYADIIKIIKIKGIDYIVNGKLSGLEKWIRALPETLVKKDPWLIFFLTMTRRIKGGKKNISDFQTALSLFEAEKEIRGMLLSIGYLIEAAVFIRQPSQRIIGWIKKGEYCLSHLCQKNRYPWARAQLWQQIGLGYIAGNGNIPKGVSACKNAILLGTQINSTNLVINASITMAFGYVQAGDFVNAGQMLIKIKEKTKLGQNPEYRALKSLVDIDFALKNGDFNTAKKMLDFSEQDIENFGLIFLYPGYVEAKALLLVYTNQFDEAHQTADHLNDFSILEGNDFYKGISHRIKALTFLKETKPARAHVQIKKALKELDLAKKGDIHHFLALQLSGMIAFQKGSFENAKQILEPALAFFERISSELCYAETCLVLGVVSFELKDSKEAFAYLKQGFNKAYQEGYTFFPLIGEGVLIRAIILLSAYGESKSVEPWILSMIKTCHPQHVFDHMDVLFDSETKSRKMTCVENLRPLYKQLLPRVRIETFGRFKIFSGDTEMDRKAFEGTKPILLLKSIVLHGTKDIPKEILIDDLWPKSSANAGEKNFKINLHRLRKAIEKAPKKEFGYSYIVQKSGLVSLDPDLISLDVDDFVSYGAAAVEHEQNNKLEAALENYQKAIGIYKGDYFAEEPYLEWISRKREAFTARYIELLKKKARLHEELDQIESAVNMWYAILEKDLYNETAYQNLMILYADSGQVNKAIEIFKECRSLLKAELGTKPDDQTFSIYSRIKIK